MGDETEDQTTAEQVDETSNEEVEPTEPVADQAEGSTNQPETD